MPLLSLDIRDFRNFRHAGLTFSPGLNLISGANAAGKTSLLEAIYCLARVRSFRSNAALAPVRYGSDMFRLVGRIRQDQGRCVSVGIERQAAGLRVRLDGQPVNRLSDLAGCFSVQLMSAETESILEGGPRCRRQALDWALFHVEHPYREYWQRYARALRQRNAAIRGGRSAAEIQVWDTDLQAAGRQLDRLRREYFHALKPNLDMMVSELLPGMEVNLQYLQGWPLDQRLEAILLRALEQDRARGHTRYGPHRADFRIEVDGRDAHAHCSRGQQKVLVLAFMLAQLGLQQALNIAPGAFLLDDFTSELDMDHQERVLAVLKTLHAQVFVTAIGAVHADRPEWTGARMFHVEHGEVQEVV